MPSGPTPIVSDLVGHTIDAGRLKLAEVLGEGTYGIVFRAVEQQAVQGVSSKDAPTEFAVKAMRRADDSSIQGQCQSREIITHKIASEHPNVLTLHKVIEDDWFIFLVLDYCPGGDLYSAIVERRTFCQNDALVKSVFVQILDAVQSCHEKSIYHRDLKPENILLNGDDSEAYLGDFGLATDVDFSSAFSCGSPFYMSPECIGEELNFIPYSTPASDVWALGIILTNMATGRNPWRQATTNDEHFHHYMSDKRFLRKSLPISEAAANVLDKIFTFSSSERITIPELRKEIMSIKTFFLTESELATAKKRVRVAAASYSPSSPPAVVPRVFVRDMDIGAWIPLQDDLDDEEYLFDSPDPDAPISKCPSSRALSSTTTLLDDGNSLFGDGLSNRSSRESTPPITPADTLAHDIMDVHGVKDLGDLGNKVNVDASGSGFSIKSTISSFIRPSLRRIIGSKD